MTTPTEAQTISMTEMKKLIKESLGTPANNQNAAAALAGTSFLCESKDGKFVTGKLLPVLSAKGKLQAELSCSEEGCTETHVREQSDWHQSMVCRTHAAAKKVKLTDEQKAARKVAKAQAVIDAANAAKQQAA